MPAFRKRVGAALLLILIGLLAFSVLRILDNHHAFRVGDIEFAPRKKARGDWYQPGYPSTAFTPVEHPFWRDSGKVRMWFETSKQKLDISVYAMDCLRSVYLDGRELLRNRGQCSACVPWHEDPDKRCKAEKVTLAVDKPGRHLLAMATSDVERRDVNHNRDQKLLFVHHENNAFWYRVLGLLSIAGIAWLLWSFWRTRDFLALPSRHLGALVRHKGLVVILLLPAIGKGIVGPSFLTTDVSESALIYTENLVTRTDLHFTRVNEAYLTAAKYSGESHMHKPPGVYYQYAIPRLLFGFNEIYYLHLPRLPSMLGDILIAWLIWAAVRARRDEWDALLAASIYALSTGIFLTTSYIGRIDSLAIAFLMLALRQVENGSAGNARFSLFLGAAVAWKHLAILITPLLITSLARLRWLVLAGLVTLALCAPYLLDDPRLFLERLIMPQLDKGVRGVTWMRAFQHFDIDHTLVIAKAITLAYMATLCILPLVARTGVWLAGVITYGLFVVAGKQVYEHYLLWSTPFLIIVAFRERSLLAFLAFSIGTISMALINEATYMVRGTEAYGWGLLVAAVYLTACVRLLATKVSYADSPARRLIQHLAQRNAAGRSAATEPSPSAPKPSE